MFFIWWKSERFVSGTKSYKSYVKMSSSLALWTNGDQNFTMKNNATDAYEEQIDSWFLMNSSVPVLLIIASYLAFVLKVGPQYMENKKPYVLKEVLILYNLAMTIFNAYLFRMLTPAFSYPIQYFCMPHPNKNALEITRILYDGCWYYLMSKIVELADTVFFVLRKKQSQVSTLHVFHHANMVFNSWIFLKYLRTEQGVVVGVLNTFVHIVMYFYYFLAALGPRVQKYLWWKKYITLMQMVQFLIIFLYLATLLAMDCEVHRGLSVYMAIHTVIFIVMFSDFYKKAYLAGKSKLSLGSRSDKSKTQ